MSLTDVNNNRFDTDLSSKMFEVWISKRAKLIYDNLTLNGKQVILKNNNNFIDIYYINYIWLNKLESLVENIKTKDYENVLIKRQILDMLENRRLY